MREVRNNLQLHTAESARAMRQLTWLNFLRQARAMTIISIAILSSVCAFAHCLEQDVPITSVAPYILQAAASARAGFVVEEATRIDDGGGVAYELEGSAEGSRYEILVSEDGDVLEIEEDDD